MLNYERAEWAHGRLRVAGLDEAGRGPLAGPVFAACVWFDRAFAESALDQLLRGLTDSKQLTFRRRLYFYELLRDHPAVHIGVGQATVEEIDRLNILRATWLAMSRALDALPQRPDCVLVDGHPVHGLSAPSRAIVGGDRLSLSIAAASVVAKVLRDRCMEELDRRWPQYGFSRHRGYGTPEHLQALYRWGPCPEHRRSFRPVAERWHRSDPCA